MKHLAAYLLLGLAGNTSPSADEVKEVLSSVGIEADDDRLSSLLSELEGKDINQVCTTSRTCKQRKRSIKCGVEMESFADYWNS